MTSVDEMASAVPTGRRDADGVPDRSDPVDALGSRNDGAADLSGTPFDRTAWLAWRKTGITATDAAAAVNLSPYASPYSVWATKIGLSDDDIEVTDSMEFGLRAEKLLGDWFTDREGLYVVGQQQWCTNPTARWMLATVDGGVAESPNSHPSDAIGGFEAKTTTDSAKAWDEEIPLHIQAQVQWQMAVTGHQRTWLAALHMAGRGVQFRVRVIERDQADIDALFYAGFNLWHDHVLTASAPPTDGHPATTDALGQAWVPVEGAHVEASPPLLSTVERLTQLKADAKTIDLELTAAENEIKAALGEATALTNGIDAKGRLRTLLTWTSQDRTTVDAKALRADEPDIAARYSKTTTSRVLRLKTIKGD